MRAARPVQFARSRRDRDLGPIVVVHIKALFSPGRAWSTHTREWVYYEAVLDRPALRSRFALSELVKDHSCRDSKAGSEYGFVCSEHEDGIMGLHPELAAGAVVVK